ncbi:MAG: two-component system, OmpR family, response regulator [Acidobacteriota bacterium]|jgi:CheY-like chemotaxis protein|nr:two-component system, OmpR family, response regulator [Acidobacteriota bacterium]
MGITNHSRTSRVGADASSDVAASRNEEACLRCEMSRSFLEAGDYERAREAMGWLWHRAGERPSVEKLGERAAAEVLLQAGRLTSTLGGARRIDGAQEAAKNLISESAAVFERLGDVKKVAEARAELGLCYWRQGAHDEARVVLRTSLDALSGEDGDQLAVTLIRLSIVEFSAKRYETALTLNEDASPLVESSESDALKGCFHSHRALTFRTIADIGGDSELRDRALVDYAAASYHFEQAGHTRYQAYTENNLAMLFNNIGRQTEAHGHIERARSLFQALKDVGSVAQCDDTCARILIAERRFDEAERTVRAAVRSLETGDRQALLAEGLATLGLAQARGGKHAEARRSFRRAIETAEKVGDRAGAGAAALALAEELSAHMTAGELCEAFARAHDLLSDTRSHDTLARLIACARRAVETLAQSRDSSREAQPSMGSVWQESPDEKWAGFSLKDEVLRYESELIARALKDAGGIVSRAARLLGFRHHQTFVALLNNRHKNLLHARNPIIPRKRSIVRVRAPRGSAQHRADRETRPVTILLVEDNPVVADAIRDTLESEGWHVEAYLDGREALEKVAGPDHFDLLLLDEDLPGMGGLELARRARSLGHRRSTPVVVISATNCRTAAREAGADAFLKKPQDILALVPTITRLLDREATV